MWQVLQLGFAFILIVGFFILAASTSDVAVTKDIPIIKNTINIKYIYFLIITLCYILYMFFIVYKGFGHMTYYEEIKH